MTEKKQLSHEIVRIITLQRNIPRYNTNKCTLHLTTHKIIQIRKIHCVQCSKLNLDLWPLTFWTPITAALGLKKIHTNCGFNALFVFELEPLLRQTDGQADREHEAQLSLG